MEPRPFLLEKLHVFRDQGLRSLRLAIGDRAGDLDDLTRGQINLQNRARLGDVHVRRRVIEGVDPNLVPVLSNDRGYGKIIPKALGYCKWPAVLRFPSQDLAAIPRPVKIKIRRSCVD